MRVEHRRRLLTNTRPLRAIVAMCALCCMTAPMPAGGQEAPAAETPPTSTHGSHEIIEEIVVTASPLGRDEASATTAVNVISRDHLLTHGGSTLGEALAHEPGISTTGFAPGASRPVIRGQSGIRVKTTENGLGTADLAALSPDHGVPVNPLVARRIEVLRGPSTLRYGGTAIGGVVNTLTDRVPSRVPSSPLSGEIMGAWGSAAERQDGAFLLDGALGQLGWHIDGAKRRSEDYEAPGGEVYNSGTDGSAYSGGLAWLGEDFRLGVARSRFQNEYGVPAGEHVIDLVKDVWHLEADWLEPVSGLSRIELRGAFSDYEHGEFEGDFQESDFDSDDSELRLEVLHDPLLDSGSLRGALGVHYIQRDFKVTSAADAFLEPSSTDTWALYAVEEWLLSDRLTAELSARLERVEVEGSLPGMARHDRRFNPFSASLGLVYRPADGVSIALRASSTERAPDATELYYLGEHHATGTYEIGNPELDLERADAAELTLRVRQGRLSLTAGLFYTDYKDYIDLTATGRMIADTHGHGHDEDDHDEDGHGEDDHDEDDHDEDDHDEDDHDEDDHDEDDHDEDDHDEDDHDEDDHDEDDHDEDDHDEDGHDEDGHDEDDHDEDDHDEDGHDEDGHDEDDHGDEDEHGHEEGGLIEVEFLQRDAVFYGGELWIDYELFEWAGIEFGLDAQFDAVRGRLDDGNVPRQPPFRYGAGLHFRGDRFDGRLGFLRHARQKRTGALETSTDAYTLLEATFAVRLISDGERSLELNLSGRNLLDERARNHLNFRKDRFLLPGRSVRVSLRGRF